MLHHTKTFICGTLLLLLSLSRSCAMSVPFTSNFSTEMPDANLSESKNSSGVNVTTPIADLVATTEEPAQAQNATLLSRTRPLPASITEVEAARAALAKMAAASHANLAAGRGSGSGSGSADFLELQRDILAHTPLSIASAVNEVAENRMSLRNNDEKTFRNIMRKRERGMRRREKRRKLKQTWKRKFRKFWKWLRRERKRNRKQRNQTGSAKKWKRKKNRNKRKKGKRKFKKRKGFKGRSEGRPGDNLSEEERRQLLKNKELFQELVANINGIKTADLNG